MINHMDELTDAEVIYFPHPIVRRYFDILDEEKSKTSFSESGDPLRDSAAHSYWDTMRIFRGEFPAEKAFRFDFWISELDRDCSAYVISDHHADALKRGCIIVTALRGILKSVYIPPDMP